MNRLNWPDSKRFAFTIIDDTDNSFIENIEPIYNLLYTNNIKTTKTVWVYPPRDKYEGESLQNNNYYRFVHELQLKGFEIALHNVGSGCFNRDEIKKGLNIFKELIGYYPRIQINHADNLDNIYWGQDRYSNVLKNIYKVLYGEKRKTYGTEFTSDYFWGDLCKEHIKYIRNYVFNGINTQKYDPKMPYIVKPKEKYSNFWFSSSDGHTIKEFNQLISPKQIDKLEQQGGFCIVYTHFSSGFVDANGELDKTFKENITYLGSKNAYCVPAGELLDYLLDLGQNNVPISSNYLNLLDFKWVVDRVIKRIRFKK